MTKRAEQRIDASVRHASEAVKLWGQADQAEKQADALLSGKGTEADKSLKAAKNDKFQRDTLATLMDWKKGGGATFGKYPIKRVTLDRDGYPFAVIVSATDLTDNKFDIAKTLFDGDREAVRRMVDQLRTEKESNPIEVNESLTGRAAEIQTAFRDWVWEHLDEAIAQYQAVNGNVLNTDEARKLSSDYNATPETRSLYSSAVHEPASWLVKEIYARELAKMAPDGKEDLVLFTAGGTGAGKSSAVKAALSSEAERAQIVFDTNMNGYASSDQKIQQALDAGKRVVIAYVFRDPLDALVSGAFSLALIAHSPAPCSFAFPVNPTAFDSSSSRLVMVSRAPLAPAEISATRSLAAASMRATSTRTSASLLMRMISLVASLWTLRSCSAISARAGDGLRRRHGRRAGAAVAAQPIPEGDPRRLGDGQVQQVAAAASSALARGLRLEAADRALARGNRLGDALPLRKRQGAGNPVVASPFLSSISGHQGG